MRASFAGLVMLLIACGQAPESPKTAKLPNVADAGIEPPRTGVEPPRTAATPPTPARRDLPRRLELADVDRYSFGLATDATHVYWVDYHGGGGVFRANKHGDGGGGREQLAGEQPYTRDVAVDDRFVYWALASATSGAPPGAIMRMPKAGGAPSTFAADQWNPDRVLAFDGRVVWNTAPPEAIMRAPSSGGAPAAIAQVSAQLLVRHRDLLFFCDPQGSLMQVPATGGTPVRIAKLDRVPADLAIDDDFAYVADVGEGVMPPARKCPKGTPCPVASATPRFPRGELVAIALAGGARKKLLGDIDWVRHITVANGSVYFTSRAGLQKLAKDGRGSVTTLEPTGGFDSRLLVDGDRLLLQHGQKIVSLAL